MNWRQTGYFALEQGKGKELQARVLGCLYNVLWICWEKGYEVQRGLAQVDFDSLIWRKIAGEKADLVNIQSHFDMIEERLR